MKKYQDTLAGLGITAVVVCVLIFVIVNINKDFDKANRRAEVRNEKAIVMCEKHEGLSHWISENQGWGPSNRYAMCVNGHKIPFGTH